MADFKYIMMNDGVRDIPIIFPDFLVHKDIYSTLRTINPTGKDGKFYTIVSAGTVILFPKIICYGESETLKVKSRGKLDSLIISLYPYQHGVYDKTTAGMITDLLSKFKEKGKKHGR